MDSILWLCRKNRTDRVQRFGTCLSALVAGVFSVITAVVLWLSPKLFQKKLELLGQNCGVQQTAAINRLKDLLTGFDVLQFFGKGDLFLQQGNRISDDIEKPSCQLSYGKSRMEVGDWLY